MPRRPILGIASDDSYLQSLIPFESTPDTARLGEFARASRASAKKGQSSEGDLPTSLTEMEVDRLQQQGKDAFLAQDLKKAVKLWGEALSKAAELNAPTPKKLQASRAAQLYANRCQAYLNLGDEKAALSDAEAAVAAAPGWPKAYYRHGTVLMRKKAYTKAYGIFKQGWHLDTSNLELTKACQKAQHTLLPDKDSGSLLLQVQLPLAKKSGDVDLAINEKCIEVEVAGVYRQLRVSIPERPAVSSSDAVARFDKHSKTLKVYLPPVA